MESQRPDLVKEWDFEENGDYTPDKASIHSPRKVGWVCEKGHRWTASIEKRTQRNQGCPYCSGRRAIPGETDLATVNPDVLKFWDYEKNDELGIYPTEVKPNSESKAWWKCEKGHSWEARIHNLNQGRRCPICSSRKVMPGVNDLETINPELAKEWHPKKNKDLKPSDVMPHCTKKVWWLGKCGHEWRADVDHRTSGRGCPICLGMKALTVERSIFEMVPEIVKDWDKEKNGDLHPRNVSWKANKVIWWKCDNGHSYKMKPNNKVKIDKKTGGTRIVPCPICSGKRVVKGINDFATLYPEIAKQWDIEKNGEIPALSKSSNRKVWWNCEKGHSWQASVEIRTRGTGCPYCAGQKLLVGFNDLRSTHPDIAAEWHPTKNGDVTPEMVGPNNKDDYWWICREGHEWQARPHNRTMNNTGCPYCYGRIAIKGKNDLATTSPELTKEWHPTKNKLKPDKVKDYSHNKVWWLCENGHEWQATIYSRQNGNGCPYCSGKLPIVGETDLSTLMPEIAAEWNYEKNRGKTPEMFTKSSNKKVWWKCEQGHEWRAEICHRTQIGHGCPICAKNRRK